MPNAPFPLGWIEPSDRNADQNEAHQLSLGTMLQFALPPVTLAKGAAIRLFDFWSKAEVVSDVGFTFDRIHQQTGSCVWAGGTIALFSTIATQRLASDNPTKAFLPFTLHNYAMSRHYFGDDGQGEGSMGSTFAKSLSEDGVVDWPVDTSDRLPEYNRDDGVAVSASVEMKWSSIRNADVPKIIQLSKQHLIGSAAECNGVQDIRAAVGNGYGVSFACNNFIGNASIRGSGADAYVRGRWDSRGGHQQSIHAVWEHPNDGPLYWAQNNWPASVYPRDPAGGPVCGCWVTETDVEAAMRLDSEVYALSHLDWFPAQPKVESMFMWI